MSTNPPSRREFLTATASGARRRFLRGLHRRSFPGCPRPRPPVPQDLVGDGRRRRILLRGGVVLSLDPRVGDFERADVLIDGKLIAEIAPNISAGDAEVVDCSGTIVMPGFITTHHHQYETLQRSIIADGLLQARGRWRATGRWFRTSGRRAGSPDPRNPGSVHLGPGTRAVRPGGLLHLGARRLPERDQRGHHLWNRHLAGQPHARAHRRHDQGADGLRPPDGLRLQRRNQPERRGHPVRSPRGHERHDEGDRPAREDVLQFKRPAGDAGLRRRRGAGFPRRGVHGMAARPLVRRVDQQPQRRQPDGDRQCGRRRPERHRLVRRHIRPRHAMAGRTVCADRCRLVGLPEGQPIESVGDLPRPGRPRLDRQPHRDADAARDASVSGGAESRHPAEPEPRRRHEHDHRPVLADAGRLLPAARAGQRPRLQGEQPR